MPPLVAWPPPGLKPIRRWNAPPVFQESLLLALPAHHPPVQSPADSATAHTGRLHAAVLYRHIGEAWMQSARGSSAPVLELASYHAIIACVAAGAARVVPQAVMGLDARAPGPAPGTPADLRTRWLVTPAAATSRPRWMRCWPHL